jgi:hypothetical protein
MKIKVNISDDDAKLIREQLDIDIVVGVKKMADNLIRNLTTLAKAKKSGETSLDLKEVAEKMKKAGI